MKLGDGVEQAIHSVLFLGGLSPTGLLSAAAIAEYHGVSTSYLLKHLQALVAAGILQSVPGPKGGYRLGRALKDISLLDIVLAVEGPEPAFRCAEIRQRGPSPLPAPFYKTPCAIDVAMLRAEQAYRAELAKVSAADILTGIDPATGDAIAARSCAFFKEHERNRQQKE